MVDKDKAKNPDEGYNQTYVSIKGGTHDHTTTQTKKSILSHLMNEIKDLLIKNAQENNENKYANPMKQPKDC
jgi:hypothetical protein